jgi:hypothetical protein
MRNGYDRAQSLAFVNMVRNRKLDLFPSSCEVGGGVTPTLLGPLERANLNHWTEEVSLYAMIYSEQKKKVVNLKSSQPSVISNSCSFGLHPGFNKQK